MTKSIYLNLFSRGNTGENIHLTPYEFHLSHCIIYIDLFSYRTERALKESAASIAPPARPIQKGKLAVSSTITITTLERQCHGPCLVTFFPKNNQRMAPTESPMIATSPLFSATITTSHPRRTYIGALSEYFLHSATTNKTCILIIVITNQHHVLSTAAQPEPHHAPGQSHCAHTSSQGHESQSPQGPVRIYVGILQHHLEYESPCYMFILLSYALHNNSLYVYVLLQYKYSSLLYVFR